MSGCSRGFTLLELLVAMTVLTFISLGVLSLLRYGIASWEHGKTLRLIATDEQLLRSFLRGKLEDAYPRYDTSDPVTPRIDFAGDDASLSFLAPAPAALGGAGFARYSLRFVSTVTGDRALEIFVRPEVATNVSISTKPSLAFRHILASEFAYYGSQSNNDVPAWHDRWISQRRLPQLIKIDVRFSKESRREWPEFIVAPRIARDAECVYDALSKDCRGR